MTEMSLQMLKSKVKLRRTYAAVVTSDSVAEVINKSPAWRGRSHISTPFCRFVFSTDAVQTRARQTKSGETRALASWKPLTDGWPEKQTNCYQTRIIVPARWRNARLVLAFFVAAAAAARDATSQQLWVRDDDEHDERRSPDNSVSSSRILPRHTCYTQPLKTQWRSSRSARTRWRIDSPMTMTVRPFACQSLHTREIATGMCSQSTSRRGASAPPIKIDKGVLEITVQRARSVCCCCCCTERTRPKHTASALSH